MEILTEKEAAEKCKNYLADGDLQIASIFGIAYDIGYRTGLNQGINIPDTWFGKIKRKYMFIQDSKGRQILTDSYTQKLIGIKKNGEYYFRRSYRKAIGME